MPTQAAASATPINDVIVTRTSSARRDIPLTDPLAGSDREWTADEERRLLAEYTGSRKIAVIAVRMQIDKRQIAIRLTRLVFEATGELEDIRTANRHRTRWTANEELRATKAYFSGQTLDQIAGLLDRTRLGVAWRLLESEAVVAAASSATVRRLAL